MYKHNTCMCTYIHTCMYKYVFMYINIHIYKQVVYLKYMQGKIVNYTPVKLGKKI